jgi:hypothetical protein
MKELMEIHLARSTAEFAILFDIKAYDEGLTKLYNLYQ